MSGKRSKPTPGKRLNSIPAVAADDLPKPIRKYLILEDMASGTRSASSAMKQYDIHQDLEALHWKALKELHHLTTEYGPLEDLAARAGLIERQAPVTAGPGATHATARVSVTRPPQSTDPAPRSVSADTHAHTAGAAALPTIRELLSAPPGPSYRVLPARATQSPPAPAREVPLAQREAIAERFRSDVAVLDAGFAIGSSASEALGWSDAQADRVLVDLHRLGTSAAMDPATAATLSGIDWSGIEALLGVMDSPPASPSPTPSPGV